MKPSNPTLSRLIQLRKENKELKRIIRQVYLHELDRCAVACGGYASRVTDEELRQLGRDLATYGTKDAQ